MRYTWEIMLDIEQLTSTQKYKVYVYYDNELVGSTALGASSGAAAYLWSAKLLVRKTIRNHRKALKQSTWEGEG